MTLIKERGLVQNNGKIEVSEYSIAEMHELGIQHMHAAVILLRQNIRTRSLDVLSQLRATDKKQFPGHWCFSAGGHCIEADLNHKDSGIADLAAVERELKEEIGLVIDHKTIGNDRLIPIGDPHGKPTYAIYDRVIRLQNGLVVSENRNGQIYQESPIFSVLYLRLLDGLNKMTFDLQTEEVNDLAWIDIKKIRQEKLTPWFRHYLNLYLKK